MYISGAGNAMFGQAIDLPGASDESKVVLDDTADFHFQATHGGSVSFSAWYRVDAFDQDWQALAVKGEGDAFRLHRRGGEQKLNWTCGPGGDDPLNHGYDTPAGSGFHHVVVTRDGSTGYRELWIDGAVRASATNAGNIDDRLGSAMMIGANPDDGGGRRWWNGVVDDAGFWNRPLTAAEIMDIWNGGTGASIASLMVRVLTWDGAADGNWSEADRWTGPKPPNFPDATVKAEIGPLGTNNTVTVAANRAAHTLILSDNGELIIGAGNTLDVVTNVNAAGRPITLMNNATLRTGGGGAIGSVATQGDATIDNGGDIASSHLVMQAGNTFTKAGAGMLSFDQSAGSNTIDGTNTVQVASGELKMRGRTALPNPIGGADLVLSGGTFTAVGPDVVTPGLLAGSHSGNPWTAGPNPGNLGVCLGLDGLLRDGGPRDAEREAHWLAARADGGNGPDDTTLIYTGQIYLAGTTTFVEQNDDVTRLTVGGQLIINDGSWDNAVSATFTPPGGAGWYDFEVRFSNGGGGYGFFGQQNTGAGDSNWDVVPGIAGGFGTAPGTVAGENAQDYTYPEDPGDASLFRQRSVGPVNLQNTLTVDNQAQDGLRHTGYHVTPDADMNLDNNGGLMSMMPWGTATLTEGPGSRGLDFNDDADFINTGAIGQGDNYMNLFLGTLHVSAANAGTWEFRNRGDDDRAGIWLDLDQDGIFESSLPGLGSDRGEQLSWEDGGWKAVALAEGDYLVAFTHGEYTGGSACDFAFRHSLVTGGNEWVIKPADLNQAGLWSFMPTSTLQLITDFDANLRELILKNGDLRIVGANLLTVEQASISTATSGKVGLITDTPTILTDVLGFNGNGQTVEITKRGSADLILNKPGTGLDNATFKVVAGRLIGVDTGAFGTAGLDLAGGEVGLSSTGPPATFDNAVTLSADGVVTAGALGGGGSGGSVNLGSPTRGITLSPGKTLELKSTDGYVLNVVGTISDPGNVVVNEGTVNLLAPNNTIGRLEAKGGTLSTAGNDVTITDELRMGDVGVTAEAGSFQVRGENLLTPSAAQRRTLSLSGGQVRLRVAGGMPTGNQLWLDAGAITGVPDGDPVTRWDDTSGQDHHADQYQGNPTYVGSGPNAQPVVHFDGSVNSQLTTTYNFDPATEYSLLTVARYTGGDNERVVSSATRNWLFGFHGNMDERWHAEGWIHDTGTGNTEWHIHAGTITADADPRASFWKDGNLLTSDDTGSGNGNHMIGRLSLGGWGSSEFSNCEVAEVLIFDHVLSASELNDVGGYLAAKYGISAPNYTGSIAPPPINLPYTDLAVTGTSTLGLDTPETATLGDLNVDMTGFAPTDTILTVLCPGTEIQFGDLVLDGPAAQGQYLLLDWPDWELATDVPLGGALFDAVVFPNPEDLVAGLSFENNYNFGLGARVWLRIQPRTIIPEPASLALLGLALAGLGGYVRRRRRA